MKLEVAIEKRHLFLFAALLAAMLGVVFVIAQYTSPIPNPGHGADTVWVNTSTGEKTLQQAIDDGLGNTLDCTIVEQTCTASSTTCTSVSTCPIGYSLTGSGFKIDGVGGPVQAYEVSPDGPSVTGKYHDFYVPGSSLTHTYAICCR
jgi:hypothetical protein